MIARRADREQDACAIIALVDKRGHATHANIVQTIDALRKMGHRSGDINGEGDGCGISTDIPRDVWTRRLTEYGLSPHLAVSRNFFVGHFLLGAALRPQARAVMDRVKQLLRAAKLELLMEIIGATRDEALGPRARADAPLFWQIAGMIPEPDRRRAARRLHQLQIEIEGTIGEMHVASLSLDAVVFKVQGLPELLPRVYPELVDEDTRSIITLGHSRYSTNTLPTVARSQPFALLGHNGEINTIERLRSTGRALGITPVPAGSDSQDLDRVVEGLINLYDLDILEAMEMVFPAIYSEVENYPPALRDLYDFYRYFFPCSAQGPAAIVARHGDVCLGLVDALGLRPLWFGESDYDYFLSSEKGVVDLKRNIADPKPLAPGEKVAITCSRGRRAEVLDYGAVQQHLLKLMQGRHHARKLAKALYRDIPGFETGSAAPSGRSAPGGDQPRAVGPGANLLAAFGWHNYDLAIRQRVAHTGREVIGSMGHTGPLAAFVPETLPNIADYFKENVAVVTNPAIDREREAEHFSTRLVLGSRPGLTEEAAAPLGLELKNPLLLGGLAADCPVALADQQAVARRFGTFLLDEVLDFFTGQGRDPGRVAVLDATFAPAAGLKERLAALCEEARQAVAAGALLLVLDDSASFGGGRVYLDPALAAAAVNECLIIAGSRRRAGLIVRSGAIRNLHDIMLLLGLGIDALNPYLLWQVSCRYADENHPARQVLLNTMEVLQKGMEKVMSTMGIHELCGYGRIFAAIGLTAELAELFQVPNFCASAEAGLGFGQLEKMAAARLQTAASAAAVEIYREPARNPKVGRLLREAALGKSTPSELAGALAVIEEEMPTGLRHLLAVRPGPPEPRPAAAAVDITVGGHDLPLVIAAMSFGSQGENSFRIYAEAARRANIICMNGEGGEIPDMLGRYRHNRGQQIASGRFGVFMDFLNSVAVLEIKIGQGAKPGEGGHLPGSKVSAMVAKARQCKAGITLISPSNHHDIYSIEDLAQIITELKTANPAARISVKIPVTSGVGTIAVGIAKAGADIINLSGFEGGTGAAREHAKRFVGLPAEIGVSEAQRALVESGLRDRVEIWTDGGMRSGADVFKMILLGANRVGFGTAALMAIGCISCQRCHLDTCPRGISTQVQTREEAAGRGVKGFVPRIIEAEADNLVRLLKAIGDDLRRQLAATGHRRLQDLVGRSDLLEQTRLVGQVDTATLLAKSVPAPDVADSLKIRLVRKPLSYLTKLIADLAMARFEQGETRVFFAEDGVRSTDRAIGTYLAGAIVRRYQDDRSRKVELRLEASVPGNGLCAFNTTQLDTIVEGGSQDGAAKGGFGGRLGVLKGTNLLGRRVDGSTGKSFAYGAIRGLLMVQNMADSRACIRLSGADVVFGGRLTIPVQDEAGNIASRAHLKGFAFEYMTGGRAVVLGDPGPWLCAGMTGGVIYQCLYPELGLDRAALKRRLARGANVKLTALSEGGLADVRELLAEYIRELERSFQDREAAAVARLADQAADRFIMIEPKPLQPFSAE